jgi:hypothetical protein
MNPRLRGTIVAVSIIAGTIFLSMPSEGLQVVGFLSCGVGGYNLGMLASEAGE